MGKGQHYMEVTKLCVSGCLDHAMDRLREVETQLPESIRRECQGNIHFYQGELQLAIDHYEAAMNADTGYDIARYHYLIGVQEEKVGDLESAFRRYQAAIEIEPDFVDAYVELGGLLMKVEDYTGALRCYSDALNLDRNDLRNYANRVVVLEALAASSGTFYSQLYKEALSAFRDAEQKLPAVQQDVSW